MATKNQLKKRMINLLEDTCNHFNSTNRSVNEGGRCLYVPTEGINSEGCAIGRKLPKASKAFIVAWGIEGTSANRLEERSVPLGRVLSGLSSTFLTRLQELHDEKIYWNGTGLSEIGVKQKENLLRQINEDIF